MNETITKIQIKNATLYHADCWDVFDEIGKVDVVITDPPYGIGIAKNGTIGKSKKVSALMLKKKLNIPYATDYGLQKWDKKLNKKYIDSILFISDDQIIFGGNYYADWLPASSCWLVWDKKNGKTDYSDCELIWTSFKTAVRKIEFQWNGFGKKT
jgi:DNA modification methylase